RDSTTSPINQAMNLISRRALLGALLPITALTGVAADSQELAALRMEVQQLEQQLKVLAHKLELQEAANSAAAAAAKVTVNDKGVTLASADNSNFIKLRALLQLDSRLFFNDGGGIANNA